MIRRHIGLIVFVLSLVFLSGCWDQVEIEDRGFIVGSGVDLAKNDQKTPNLMLTQQFVVPAGLGTPTEGGGDEPAYDNLTAVGPSLFEISRKMAERTSKIPFFEHEKIIVISRRVAETPKLFGKVMDIFLRNPEMRRNIKVVVADGMAKDVLDTKPDSEKIPVRYLDDVMENSFTNASEIPPVKVGTVHEHLLDKVSYVLPIVTPKKKSMQQAGGAVFRGYDNQMVGQLDSQETRGVNFITGNAKEGVINTTLNKENITFELENAKSRMRIDTKDPDHLRVHITIHVTGAVSETFGTENTFDDTNLNVIKKHVSQEIKKMAKKSIAKTQNDLHADVLGVNNYLKDHHYRLWLQLKDNWDLGANKFSDVSFSVKTSTRIRTTGNVNRTKLQ